MYVLACLLVNSLTCQVKLVSSRGMALVQMRYAVQAVNAQRLLDQVREYTVYNFGEDQDIRALAVQIFYSLLYPPPIWCSCSIDLLQRLWLIAGTCLGMLYLSVGLCTNDIFPFKSASCQSRITVMYFLYDFINTRNCEAEKAASHFKERGE